MCYFLISLLEAEKVHLPVPIFHLPVPRGENKTRFCPWKLFMEASFFLCVCVCVCVYVHAHTELCLILCAPMDCSLLGSTVLGVLQAWILELVTISYSRESSWPRDRNPISCFSCTGRQILYHCATLEAPFPFYSRTQTRVKVGTHFKLFSLPDAIQGQEVSQHNG